MTKRFLVGIADNIGYHTESEGYLRGNTSGRAKYRGCRAGLTSIDIDSVGNVRGCKSYNYFTNHKLYESLKCALK